ncbi:MAG TPA: undecaprenyldiphospho-muramoylpentapeptide beta-N-acetylglucosaminyltransferase [Gemmatimonadales bacterium]|nr:undecaprenyldiphospho-muramoylpentapeptide beta-N-acetylglucosaminyltransferase [Gemmatimonadales bacterium]
MKVLFTGGGTGGHLMPALALAQALKAERPDAECVIVGAERGIESEVLPRYPYRYVLLPIEPIYRHAWWRNLRLPIVAWRAWRAAGAVLEQERPDIVVGTGGYVSGPVVWRAQQRGIPTALQEQNALPGITTRWLARRARQIYLGFPEAQARLRPGARTIVFSLGNPIRPPAPAEEGDRPTALAAFGLAPERPTLLVFGGSQGARALNYAVAGALEHGGLSDINLLWGTGPMHASTFARYAVRGRVVVQGFFDPMARAYRAADLVVCRAGAMTTAEVCAWGKASVLVPLPHAAANHQLHNARALEQCGAAVLLEERDLMGRSLSALVHQLLADPARRDALARAARSRGRPDAAREVVSKILTLFGN